VFRQIDAGLHNVLVQQLEVGMVTDTESGQVVEHGVVAAHQQTACAGFVAARGFDRLHHLGAVLPVRDHLGNQHWRMLQVTVHHNHGVMVPASLQAGSNR